MKARSMTLKLLLWLVKLAVDAAPADQSRLVSWDVLQKQTFLPANTSSPYRWHIQGESADVILLVAAKWVAKEAELPSFHLRWQRSGLRLTVYGLVGDMVMATDAQHNPKAVKLESVELVTQLFS